MTWRETRTYHMTSRNTNLAAAKVAKNDEFYTLAGFLLRCGGLSSGISVVVCDLAASGDDVSPRHDGLPVTPAVAAFVDATTYDEHFDLVESLARTTSWRTPADICVDAGCAPDPEAVALPDAIACAVAGSHALLDAMARASGGFPTWILSHHDDGLVACRPAGIADDAIPFEDEQRAAMSAT